MSESSPVVNKASVVGGGTQRSESEASAPHPRYKLRSQRQLTERAMESSDFPGMTHRTSVEPPGNLIDMVSGGKDSIQSCDLQLSNAGAIYTQDGVFIQSITRPIVATPPVIPTCVVSSNSPVYSTSVTTGDSYHPSAGSGMAPRLGESHLRGVTRPVSMEQDHYAGEMNQNGLGHDPMELIKQLSNTVLSLPKEVLALKEQRSPNLRENPDMSNAPGTCPFRNCNGSSPPGRVSLHLPTFSGRGDYVAFEAQFQNVARQCYWDNE